MRHHGEGLLREVADEEWVEGLKRDYREVSLTPDERRMLDYVDLVTRTPGAVQESDVERLRGAGFNDKAILEINQIAGFFAWCNRTVSGLGVELEDFWSQGSSNV